MSSTARVRVPATSANLGPGFDCLGLALGRYDEVGVRVTASGLDIVVDGEGAAEVPRDESHLVVRAIRAAFDRLGGQPGGLAVRCRNAIPHGRGLGSSAAAVIAGLVAARALVPDGTAALPDSAVLALATSFEGHPDNVAACLFGGLTIAWMSDGVAGATRSAVHPDVRPVLFVPASTLSTDVARSLLPDAVPLRDAVSTVGRAALLVHALTAEPSLLLPATEDWLHQTYRTEAMPQSAALISGLRADGVPAVVSGAGPSVLAFASADLSAYAPAGWLLAPLTVDRFGAVVLPETGCPHPPR